MNKDNPALTGFFKDGEKRIDLVLVIGDAGSQEIEELRVNYLMNVIKFGFELELEEGTMSEHRNLIFVKVHATDAVIEEYGLYFNERKFFKDSHVELIHPYGNFLGMKHEREFIKIVREQYPGPVNYSTLERSKIVYKIFLRLQFGQHENFFGLNRLLARRVIIDAFALHDGPYFITSGQSSTCINARQTLFYNWVGIINIWRTQPIYMIQEYLGERVAYYFAYYENFNWMLLLPAILGLWVTLKHYYEKPRHLDYQADFICHHRYTEPICPQCRYFDLCPFRSLGSYCREVKFINIIDTPNLPAFSFFISLWAIIFSVLWPRTDNYLAWMWEVKEKYSKNIIKPEYYSSQTYYRSYLTGVTLNNFIYGTFKRTFLLFLFVTLFGAWLFSLFLLSVHVWYIKYWLQSKESRNDDSDSYYREHLYIGMGAGVYSILAILLRMVAKTLSYSLTALENNKTYGSYDCSLALKLYGFFFSGTFALLSFHLLMDHFFTTHHILDMRHWYTIAGYGVMNNGFGTSLDDISITLAVIIVIEQVLIKIPSYLNSKRTDYLGVLNTSSPCWEKEYKLDTLRDNYVHNGYNTIAIQFAMATLFSSTFTLAPLLLLLINIWDIRHRARNILLSYRRPLLLNLSGPTIWHKIIYLTAYAVPIFNTAIIALQSRAFVIDQAKDIIGLPVYNRLGFGERNINTFKLFTGVGSPTAELIRVRSKVQRCFNDENNFYHLKYEKGTFYPEHIMLSVKQYRYQYLFLYSVCGVLMSLLIRFLIPSQSNVIDDAIMEERKIKQKYYIQKGILPNVE